jgi:TetR/AcrR family transcriptional regulator
VNIEVSMFAQAVHRTPDNETTACIMREAWRLFQEKGYRGVSVNEVCARCSISKPTLYYYFADKEDLFVQVMLRQMDGYRVALEQPGSLQERLERHATAILSSLTTDVSIMMRDLRHVENQAHHETLNEAFRREILNPVVGAMQDGIAHREIRAGDVLFYAWAYLALLQVFVDPSQRIWPADVLAGQVVHLFFHGAGMSHSGATSTSTTTSIGGTSRA